MSVELPVSMRVFTTTQIRPRLQKILSVARYLLASNGQSLPGITTWQYNHPFSLTRTGYQKMSTMISLKLLGGMNHYSRTFSGTVVIRSADVWSLLMIPPRYQRIQKDFLMPDMASTKQRTVKKITAVINETACAEQKKFHGFFALVSNCEKEPFEALRIYRTRRL